MLAVTKTAPGDGNVSLREWPEPVPGPGQVRIAVRAAGICGTDLHILHDEYATAPPVILRHEIAGVVDATGPGVTAVREGDRVTTETYFHTCGACRFCRDGAPNLCPDRRSIGSAVNGGFAPWVIVPERNARLLPDHLPFHAAALTGARWRPTLGRMRFAIIPTIPPCAARAAYCSASAMWEYWFLSGTGLRTPALVLA